MGETLAETRLEINAKKAELERTSAQLREALDVKRLVKENPLPIIAIGATGAFLIAGGPQKMATLVRRRFFPSRVEKTYDSLPKPMQSWVDHMAGAVGPRAEEARDDPRGGARRWRSNPRKNGKISKKLAKQIAEGPPGPSRTAWTAAEAVATVVLTAIARKAVMRVISGQPEDQTPASPAPSDSGKGSKAVAAPPRAATKPAKSGPKPAAKNDASRYVADGYSAMSAPPKG